MILQECDRYDLPLNTDDKDQLLYRWDVESIVLFGHAGKTNLLALGITVLLDVLLGPLEDDGALLLGGLRASSARSLKMIFAPTENFVDDSVPKDG